MADTKSPLPKREMRQASTTTDEDDPDLWSAALTAAGELIAMARDGVVPDVVTLRTGPDGRWFAYPIDRRKIPPFDCASFTVEQGLAGTVARALYMCDDDIDIEAIKEFARALLYLRDRFCPTFVAVCNLIERHSTVLGAIASRLVVTKSMEREELAAYLAPILRRK
jgi:hypothetical protein